ncbi:MAG: endolytic transglycosylase MltG [Pseudomonadota bacterium]
MKNFFLTFISLIFLGLAGAAIAFGLGAHFYLNKGPLEEPKLVLIEQGMGVSQIARKLEQEQVIHNAFLFKIVTRFSESLKAGEYEFDPHISMAATIQKMQEGDVFDRKITIVEGLTVQQIVKRLNERDDLSGEIERLPKEGSLLPNTYQFVKGETRQGMIDRMQNNMNEAIEEYWPQRASNLPFQTKDEAIILASIIEKETSVPKERAKVAGVFINRLNIGMPLQTDPTVIYAITKGDIEEEGRGPLGRRLLKKDLEYDSPYNTYKYPGLPPGPIANPGSDSIKAALNPADHDYLYFVADGTGGHAFGKTLAEHNRNVAEWRKIRSSQ